MGSPLSCPPPRAWRLYVITDRRLSRGRPHGEIVEAALAGGADVIQLRDKEASSRELYEAAREIRHLTRRAGAAFVVNDRLDVALAAGADGVHVGDEDLPVDVVRRILGPGRILGVSASTPAEGAAAEAAGADYLGVGAVFEARGTKADAGGPIGPAALAEVCRSCAAPVVAIGGIDSRNVVEVMEAGASCAAVISAVVAADDVEEAARTLREAIERAGRAE